jgi:Fe2+ or Zn2+ uptake regulation protein
MTAQQILDYVRKTYPDIGLDTIYRNVNLLITLGVVAQINIPGKDGNLFELMDGTSHHHHAVCIRCGKTECLDFCPIDDQEIEQLERNGFTLVSHSLQFFGYCRSCQC